MSDDQVQIPFAGGVNETVDPRHLPPGSVTALSNVSFDAEGQYQLRFGYFCLGLATSVIAVGAGTRRLHVVGNELLLNDGAHLWTFLDSTIATGSTAPGGTGSWIQRDTVPQLHATRSPLVNSSTSFQSWSETVANGYRVVAWVDNADGFARAAVFATLNGNMVQAPSTFGTATNVQVGVIGNTAILLMATSTPAIVARTLNLSPLGSWSGATTLSDANLTVTTGVYAVTFMSATFALVYQNGASGAAQTLRMRSFNSSLTLQQNVQGGSTTLTGPFTTIAANGTTAENLWIGVTSSASNLAKIMNVNPSTLAAVAGPLAVSVATNINAGSGIGGATAGAMCRISSTQVLYIVEILATGALVSTWSQYTTAGIVGVASGAQGWGIASQPFPFLGTAFVLFRSSKYNNFSTYVVGDLQSSQTAVVCTPLWVATLCPLIARNDVQSGGTVAPVPPAFISISATQWEAPTPVMRTANGRFGLELVSLNSQAAAQYSQGALGKEFYIGGSYYDGQILIENGFTRVPNLGVTVNAVGTVSYQYYLTLARVDNSGNIEESAPSLVANVLSTAPPNVTVQCDAMHITNKQRLVGTQTSSVFMRVYRTPNLANGDVTPYLVTVDPPPANCLNVQTSNAIAYTDTMADASLTDGTHPVLYTFSGELSHNPPESPTHVCSHKNRIWAIGADQRSVWFSQTYTDGFVPAWSLLQIVTVDDTNETLIGLATMYDKVLIFTQKRIYVVFGDGPSINGTGSDLTVPQRVASGTGTVDPRSIVNTPIGVFFQSFRGIEVIKSDLTVDFIGLPVSVTTKNFPICTSAVMCPNTSTVRFTMVTAEQNPWTSATGVVVIYDLRRDRWTYHYITQAALAGQFGTQAPIEGAGYHNTYGYVIGYNANNAANAIVLREMGLPGDQGLGFPYCDFGTVGVPMSMSTAWIKSNDLQGWGKIRRIRFLGQFYDIHTITASLDYDYQPVGETHFFSQLPISSISARTVQGPVVASGTNPPAVQIVPLKQTATPLTLEIDIQTTGGAGTATFQWKIGGVVQQSGVVIPTDTTTSSFPFTLGTTGFIAIFPVALYTNNNVYTSVPVTQQSVEQARIVPGNGKCEAIRVNLTMTPPAPPCGVPFFIGRGGGFTGLAFELHRHKGGYRNIGQAAKA